MARKPLSRSGVLLYVVLCCAAFAPVSGVTNKLYEWARADNTDPAVANQLNDCYGLIVSKDDKHIYGITREESSLITMQYNKDSGTISILDIKTKGGDGVTGLDHPAAIVMSPDGLNVYVTSPIESTVTHYSRDPDSGMLTAQETLKDGRDEVTSLSGASSMSISDDGKRLYVAGKTDNAITTFNVNGDDGTLTVNSVVVNDNSGGLYSVAAVTSSHDGAYVYAVSPAQSYMTVMRRDPIAGTLAVTQRILDQGKQWGLDAVEAVITSNDDKQVYVLSSSGALTVFARYDGNANEPLVPVRRYLEGLDAVTGLIGGRGLAITPDGSTVIVAADTGKVTMFGRSSDGFLQQAGQLTTSDVPGVNKASRVAVSSTGTVVVGGWGLVSALETTESPNGPIPPPQAEKAPRAPTMPRAPTAAGAPSAPSEPKAPRAPREPSAPTGPKAPKAPHAPGESYESGSYDSNSIDYLESGEALGPPPAQIDVIPTGKKKITFPTGTVLGVAGGLLAFTIIAVLADRSATNNFCRPLRKKMGGRSSSEMQMRGGSGSLAGSMAPSGAALVDAEAPDMQMSVPAGAEDVVLEAIPLASPQASAPLEGFAGASGDHNV